MSDLERPSDAFEPDELRAEFDWMYEFQSRMAESIRGDADVHNLVDYVNKLEADNKRLRDLAMYMHQMIDECTAYRHPYPQQAVSYLGLLEVERRMKEAGVEVME